MKIVAIRGTEKHNRGASSRLGVRIIAIRDVGIVRALTVAKAITGYNGCE